jgi:hypothetical protein
MGYVEAVALLDSAVGPRSRYAPCQGGQDSLWLSHIVIATHIPGSMHGLMGDYLGISRQSHRWYRRLFSRTPLGALAAMMQHVVACTSRLTRYGNCN